MYAHSYGCPSLDCQFDIENTLASIQAAINNGITFINIDVKLTKDGLARLFHDRNLCNLGLCVT
ncbi:MAG: hypothetical protein HRT37_11210 [Alteromonadaceae bacterium]|nr:hypothetical protein [Alteromonadaceae bacterium]